MSIRPYRQSLTRPEVLPQSRSAELWERPSTQMRNRARGEVSSLGAHPVMGAGTLISSRYVIDGQHRLRTLQMFLAAARDLAQGRGLDQVAAQLVDLLM